MWNCSLCLALAAARAAPRRTRAARPRPFANSPLPNDRAALHLRVERVRVEHALEALRRPTRRCCCAQAVQRSRPRSPSSRSAHTLHTPPIAAEMISRGRRARPWLRSGSLPNTSLLRIVRRIVSHQDGTGCATGPVLPHHFRIRFFFSLAGARVWTLRVEKTKLEFIWKASCQLPVNDWSLLYVSC
jgi:hypothetical protein